MSQRLSDIDRFPLIRVIEIEINMESKTFFQKFTIPLLAVSASISACSKGANKNEPMDQFVAMFGSTVSKSCTALILGAYQTNLQAEEIAGASEMDMKKKNPKFGKALESIGKAKYFLFNDEKIHQDLLNHIAKVPVEQLQTEVQNLTPAFTDVLKKHKNSFFQKCENEYLGVFMKCKKQNNDPRDVASCFNTGWQTSAEIRKMYEAI
jgi:hypothetical protein